MDIRRDWTRPHYRAVPYLDAMETLHRPGDRYGTEDARSIVTAFLAITAEEWKGDEARRLKAELRSVLR